MSTEVLKSALGLKTKVDGEANTITLEFQMPENSFVSPSNDDEEQIKFIFDNKSYYANGFTDILRIVVTEIGIENVYNDYNPITNKKWGDIGLVVSKNDHDNKFKEYFNQAINIAWLPIDNYYLWSNLDGSFLIILTDRIATGFGKIFNVDYNFPKKFYWDEEHLYHHLYDLKFSKRFLIK